MKSNVQMFPNEKDKDTFTSPAKRNRPGTNQFMTSSALYGDADPRPAQKKISTVKVAEMGGSNKVTYMNYNELRGQKL